MNRREFLKVSAAAAAASVAGSSRIMPRVLAASGLGANEEIRVGFIGAGGRGRHLMTLEGLDKHAKIVAIADCFEPRCHEAAKPLEADGKATVNKYQNYHQMLEKEKLDAVFIPTTTHARALIAIHAMQAGLDVYAEKPICLTVAEGRTLIKAARKYNRIFQAGTQQRSLPINVWASKLVREGAIGKVHTVLACNFTAPVTWQPQPEQPMPEGLDWDQWCNQTELRPYHPDLQYKWAKYWDYDGGGLSWGVTGWGTHALDQVQCVLGTDDTTPVEVWPETPGPEGKVTMKYANGILLKLHGERLPKYDDLGAIFQGDKGEMQIMRGELRAKPAELIKDAPPGHPVGPGEAIEHLQNFFECMRSRKRPNADVEIAHRSTTVCYLVNICRELGRKLKYDPKAEQFVDDKEANQKLSRPRRKGYELPDVG